MTALARIPILALAVFLLAACAQPGTEEPDASGSASLPPSSGSPDGTVEPTETSAPTPSPSAGAATWTLVATFEEPDTRATVHAVAAWGDGFVAIGERWQSQYLGVPGQPRLWISSDGTAWAETAPELGYQDAGVVGGSVLEDGRLLLIGSAGDGSPASPYLAKAWVSEDASAWTEIEVPFSAQNPSGEGTAAVAYASGPVGHVVTQGNRIYYSATGTDWELVHEAQGDGLGLPGAGDEGFVVTSIETTSSTTTVLASGDGVAWFEGEPRDIVAPTPLGGDWLGWEYSQDPSTIMLTRSANGLDWEAYQDVNELTPPDGPKAGNGMESEITQVDLATAAGLVVMTFGWNHCCAQLPMGVMVLTSTDATDWTEVDLGEGAFVTASAADDERIVLGGYLNRGQAAAFWVLER